MKTNRFRVKSNIIRLRSLNLKKLVAVFCFGLLQITHSQVSLTHNGTAALEYGRFEKGKWEHVDFQDITVSRSVLKLKTTAQIEERMKIIGSFEIDYWFNTFPSSRNKDRSINPLKRNVGIIIDQAEGQYIWGNPEKPYLKLGIGHFPVKYNQDVQNLGEYLFRSGTYPAFLVSGFDYAYTRLSGVRLGSHLGPLHQELYVTAEQEIAPLQDISVTYLFDLKIGRVLTLGSGVSLHRIFSADDSLTTPKNQKNIYIDNPRIDPNIDTTLYPASITGDTGYYTFSGTKLMGRVNFDPKGFLPENSLDHLFGEDELKIYSEVAILGLKSYPRKYKVVNNKIVEDSSLIFHYDLLDEKMPLMVGMNLPVFAGLFKNLLGFSLIDLCALELEWYKMPYPNDFNTRDHGVGELPLPIRPGSEYDWTDYSKDNFKWSLFLQKHINPWFNIKVQFARDHIRHKIIYEWQNDEEEILTLPKHWYWMARTEFNF